MSYSHVFFHLRAFVREEELKNDGSNFIEWYQRLRKGLRASDTLFVIEEPLGDEPNDSEDDDDKKEYRTHRDLDIVVKSDMLCTMAPELKVQFSDTNASDMIDGLKSLFVAEVRKMRYKCLDEFLSTKLEENTCLERHLENMHRIHANLVHVWGYHVTNKFAVDGVLRSLPPSYRDLVK